MAEPKLNSWLGRGTRVINSTWAEAVHDITKKEDDIWRNTWIFRVVQTTLSNKFIQTKMSIHMFLPVVFVLEKEIDLLQQHMAI